MKRTSVGNGTWIVNLVLLLIAGMYLTSCGPESGGNSSAGYHLEIVFQELEIHAGENTGLSAYRVSEGRRVGEEIDSRELAWRSLNRDIAVIYGRDHAAGISAGEVPIQVQEYATEKKARADLTVLPAALISFYIEIASGANPTEIGETLKLRAWGKFTDSTSDVHLTHAVLWESSDETVMPVGFDGVATANAIGEAVITTTEPESGFQDSLEVQVIEPEYLTWLRQYLEYLESVESDWANRDILGFNEEIYKFEELPLIIQDMEYSDVRSMLVEHGFDDWLADRYFALDNTYPMDLTERPYTRTVVIVYPLLMRLAPGQPKLPGADHWPGVVAPDAPRVSRSYVFDFDRANLGYLRISRRPGHWLGTGLYAPPGEDITITVEPGTPYTDVGGGPGLVVRIGTYWRTLVANDSWRRPPIQSLTQELSLGENVISHPFGGLLYLQSGDFRESLVNVTVSGAVEAPHFVLGRDSDAEWIASIRDRPVPLGELVGQKMIITAQSDVLRALDTPEFLTAKYDTVMDNLYELSGLSAAAPLPHTAPDRPARAVSDIHIYIGAAHSGFPLGFGALNLGSMEYSTSGTFYHEVGHNYLQGGWRCQLGSHGLNDIFTVYNQQIFGEPTRIQKNGGYDSVEIDLANGVAWEDLNDRAGKLVFYTQIALAFGWSVYTEIFRFRREDPAAFPANTVEEQCDTFLELASEFSGHDLRSHFAHYGITNTPETLQWVADMNLPEPDPAVWTFREDPLPAELLRILPMEDDAMLEHDDVPPPPRESDTPTVNPFE